MRIPLACFLSLCGVAHMTLAQENAVQPYTDPSQLDCPFPKHSFYKEPWRGFLETRSADAFLHGIGINYNVRQNDDLAVRLLAESGFKAFRIEVGWGQIAWDESSLRDQKRLHHVLEFCKQYGIRPTLLLNANHGVPCPMQEFDKRLAEDAPRGSRSVKFTDNLKIVPGRSGLSQLSGYIAAECLITAIDPATGECTLSKPLPKDLPRDKPVRLATLKYPPVYPVGTPEFEVTAAGWVRYARLVTEQARLAGIDAFDVEIWNELSFGSNFTEAWHYFDPSPFTHVKDFLHEGGGCWEIARRTVEAVKKDHPNARCIWGFSNTTFYHCPIAELPPGTDGQSYHPYGTGTRALPAQETHKDHPEYNLEGYTPTIDLRMPEGWAHTFVQTECLMRLLNPEARKAHPKGTAQFHHYMTEHGVAPPEDGVKDAAGGWDLKTRCALRSYCLWLNKGVDVLEYYCAWEKEPLGMGLMPPGLPALPADSKWDDVATPPMRAVRNLTRAFAGAVPLESTQPLHVAVTELGEPRKIFEGDASHPPLWQRDAFAFLPFQVNAGKFVVAVYAMTYDATRPFPEQTYRLKIGGLPGGSTSVSLYDPAQDKRVDVKVLASSPGTVELQCPITDSPRLLTISP